MSYEYRVTSNTHPASLYKIIRTLIEKSQDYKIEKSTQSISSFRNSISDRAWSSDIDLFFSPDGVFLDVHSGSARKLLEYLAKSLAELNIHVDFLEEED